MAVKKIPLPPGGPGAVLLFLVFLLPLGAEPFYSPTWGFRIDPPEGYTYAGGDGKTRFSFSSGAGGTLDLAIYPGGTYPSVEALARDGQKRLNSRGDMSVFTYGHKNAALLSLDFSVPGAPSPGAYTGWGLCVELDPPGGTGANRPMLLALAYGRRGNARGGVVPEEVHLSALDSIAPGSSDRRTPGPVTEFAYPRGERIPVTLAGKTPAFIREHDAEAAQALVNREFAVLKHYMATPLWKEAWIRFYRAIYRDSFDRLAEAAFALERAWSIPPGEAAPETSAPGSPAGTTGRAGAGGGDGSGGQNLELAAKALKWVQSFAYERDLLGSDFVNLVSAAVEGRGDCDSRALLWAIVLEQADIPAAIMISREYSHAMGLADIAGAGARFETGGKRWLVAETTAPVRIGLIGEKSSEISKWIGVTFE